MKIQVDIVFVRYAAPEIEKAALESLKQTDTRRVACRVLDINNYNPSTRQAYHSLTYIWNTAIRRSDREYICLLNTDVLIQDPLWLEKMVTQLEAHKYLGAVGPSTNNCRAGSQNGHTVSITGRNERLRKVDTLSGFCLVIKKSVWKALGGFDERIPFYGAESEFLHRMQRAGWSLGWCVNAFVFHHGEASIKLANGRGEIDHRAERQKGIKLFKKIIQE